MNQSRFSLRLLLASGWLLLPAILLAETVEVPVELLQRLEARLDAQDNEIAELRAALESQRQQLSELSSAPAPASYAEQGTLPAPERDTTASSGHNQAPVPAAPSELQPMLSKYDVRFYGYVKLDTFYDSDRTSGGNLSFYVPPESDASDGQTGLTANQSRFGFDVTGPSTELGTSSGKLEVDFYGSNSPQNKAKLRMRHAYLNHDFGNDFAMRFGQDWDTLIYLHANTIDFDSLMNHGKLGFRRPQARVSYTPELGDGSKLDARLAVARTIGEDIDDNGLEDGLASETPSVQAGIGWKPKLFGDTALVALSGHIGNEEVQGSATVVGDDYTTWSVNATGKLPLGAGLALSGSVWTGSNLDTYTGGIGQGINGALGTEINASGGWAQLTWKPADRLSLNLTYGLDDPDDDDLSPGMRSRNESWGGNIFYTPIPAIEFGLEYTNMTTDYRGGDEADNNRIQAASIYKF